MYAILVWTQNVHRVWKKIYLSLSNSKVISLFWIWNVKVTEVLNTFAKLISQKNFSSEGTTYFPHCYYFCTTQFGNLAIFIPLQLYMKSILADFRMSKTSNLTISEALNFDFRKNFTFEMSKVLKNTKFRAAQMFKMAVLGLQIEQNWFHVKSE